MEVAKNILSSIRYQIDSCINECMNFIDDQKRIIEEKIEDQRNNISFLNNLKLKVVGHDRIKVINSLSDLSEDARDINIIIKDDGLLIVSYIHIDKDLSGDRELIYLDKNSSTFIMSIIDSKTKIEDKDIIESIKFVCGIPGGLHEKDAENLMDLCKVNYNQFKERCMKMDINPSDFRYVLSNVK